jgi:REP element-mobilizing transposase RayT
MVQPAYELDATSRKTVLRAILETCRQRGWTAFAVHVRTAHVHVVVEAWQQPERVMATLKAYASRALGGAGRRRWSRHGSTRYLWNRKQVERTIGYVIDEQGEAMEVFVKEDR